MLLRAMLVILFAGVFGVSIGSAQEFVTDGLIAMWTFDDGTINGDTVVDQSGVGTDATMIGDVATTEGVIGEGLLFEAAADSYIEIPALGEFEAVSCECWAYEEAFGGIQGIVSTWQWIAGKVHFKFQDNQIQVDKNGAGKIALNADAQTWYHIIYTTEVPDAVKLYVDGELVAEQGGGAEPELWDERRIGSEHDGRWLNGMIDEVRIYDRALTEDEVSQNFAVKNNIFAVDPSGKLATSWGSLKVIR